MAVAGAAADCLKRCFRQLGDQFGNSLYDKEVARNAGKGTSVRSKGPDPTGVNGVLKYGDGTGVDTNNQAEFSAYQAFLKAHTGQIPPSRQALRAWVSAMKNGDKGQA